MTPKFGENLVNFQSMQKKHFKLKVTSLQIMSKSRQKEILNVNV